MAQELTIRLYSSGAKVELPATLVAAGDDAAARLERLRAHPGVHLLLSGHPAYCVTLRAPIAAADLARLRERQHRLVTVAFPGRSPLRRRLAGAAGLEGA